LGEIVLYFRSGNYDVAVIGAGHAGCEAAIASAKLGCSTVIFTINLDGIANIACNPNIGGTAKGHLVKEIDALGGVMGKIADKCCIQARMLNRGKGPAVHSLRVQIDRNSYKREMKKTIEEQENLDLVQSEIVRIEKRPDGLYDLYTHLDAVYTAKCVVIASGTYLKGKIIIGETSVESGPDGLLPANKLSQSLRDMGIQLRRFKTGTPARVNARSIDFSKMEVQLGEEGILPFSFESDKFLENRACCYLTYTSPKTHEIIRANLHRSPLYSGKIEGIGPRYCPSIEDKIVKFADKERHQVFIEPMGLDTYEMYVQGMSSSLPIDVQEEMYKSVPGLENVKIMRSAYAIEYDCVDPLSLKPSLEFIEHEGLFGAGQFNGSSGYEEAAAQGLIAGINAARKVKGLPPFTLSRDEAYIGVLIDDLVTKGTNEPYRMMTSRSEYRLLLRQDNADLRLTEKGYEIGLISEERYQRFLEKKERIKNEVARCEKLTIAPSGEVNSLLSKYNSTEIKTGVKLAELIRRPELSYEILKDIDPDRPGLSFAEREEVNIMIKYDGYIKRQEAQAKAFKKMENMKIPQDIDYEKISGLRIEARQKLSKIRPENIGQASRISGVSPADITVLMLYLQIQKNQNRE